MNWKLLKLIKQTATQTHTAMQIMYSSWIYIDGNEGRKSREFMVILCIS